ncbi:putative transposase [Desulfosarcina sp. BuS5]|uniref:transposase n=1 Tax=Desulfosarcina sp. BuS5 TaxID=933262 RepID=UPI002378AAFB|nr:transposase [Desulfosarcina sp. BuS5]WDN87582.1 putative transposase [Desulfosarcina sp. BuS5]
MPNNVHLIAVPETKESLMLAIGEAHRRYSRMINFREGWKGHLWQGRFASYVLDEVHLLASAHYIEMNPVRAKLVKDPTHWTWSSAFAHTNGGEDKLCENTILNSIGK